MPGDMQIDPIQEGRRIVSIYLSSKSWSAHWRDKVLDNFPLYRDRSRADDHLTKSNAMIEDAEDTFSSQVEEWRRSSSPLRHDVLSTIVQMLHHRNDLGFFARRIVDRLRREGY